MDAVQRFARILIFALLAVWLPTTLHCRAEAAGLFETREACCPEESTTTGSDCKDDLCATLEGALYKEQAATFQLAAPVLAGGLDLTAFLLVVPATDAPAVSPPAHAPANELAVRWQFIERAAPPARAP